MENQKQSGYMLRIALWVVQFTVSATLIWAASMKWFQTIDSLAAMWPWAGEISPVLVRLTGIPDLLGGLGVLLPSLLRVKPKLAPIAAMGVILLMVCAGIFHIARGEGGQIAPNIIFAALAGFVAWGRLVKVPVEAK